MGKKGGFRQTQGLRKTFRGPGRGSSLRTTRSLPLYHVSFRSSQGTPLKGQESHSARGRLQVLAEVNLLFLGLQGLSLPRPETPGVSRDSQEGTPRGGSTVGGGRRPRPWVPGVSASPLRPAASRLAVRSPLTSIG